MPTITAGAFAVLGVVLVMQFYFPWMLFGALGISIPIVIHLLNRYRYKLVDWGAMELLRRAVIVRSRRIRIEDILLMLLRCLAILLLALALARPALTPAGGGWLGSGDVGAVVAVDASFSMAHKPGVHSRFDRALERTREAVKSLKPGSPVTLVLLGQRPRVLLRNFRHDAERFEAKLKEVQPLPEALNLERCLDEIETLMRDLSAPARECYLITDAQANTWGALSNKARHTLNQIAQSGKTFFVPVAAEQHENLAITRFERKSGLLRKDALARYDIDVVNTGANRRDNVTISILRNDVPIDQRIIDRIEPGESATAPVYLRFSEPGIDRLTARLADDELTLDNARHTVADIRDQTRVLYVRAPSAEGQEESDYLLAALRPRPTNSLEVDAISWLDLPTRKLADYSVVVLANVPDLADEQVRALDFFVQQGGGLLVFLGDNVQPVIYNARFRVDKTPLLPVELTETVSAAEGVAIEPSGHPMSRILSVVPETMLGQARVYRFVGMRLGDRARSVVDIAGRNEPIVAEKSLGQGKVVVFAAAAERTWTNMVVEPGFYPLLVHEALTWMGQHEHEQPFAVGDAIAAPLRVKDASSIQGVTFQAPGGRPVGVSPAFRDGQLVAELSAAEQPGFYEIRTNPPTASLFAAVNVAPNESRVRALTAANLTEAFRDVNLRTVAQADPLEGTIKESRGGRELWKEFLLAGLIVLLLEGFLALWFTRRMSSDRKTEIVENRRASAPAQEAAVV